MPLKAPERESRSTRTGAAAVEIAALTKTFETGSGPVAALHEVTFAAAPARRSASWARRDAGSPRCSR